VSDAVLRVEGLQAHFFTPEGVVKAVNGVSLELPRGSTLAVLGESGAGKTSLGLAILNLLPHPGRVVAGRVFLEDTEISGLKDEEMRRLRGRDIAMIFQDPVGGLNPVLPVGVQVEEIITAHLAVPPARGQAARPGRAIAGGPAGPAAGCRQLPLPPVGRNVSAGDDRHRHCA